ncbi:MAG: AzlD domain-containing protein [Ktedonobacteraceae bacterium]|nr:AzlD domain-containing protein [Ktedonobacteraceae bacterium]MBO0791145.1 AzlD domain-containing protein [Ktedonobacteraceae bacterium]
MTGWLLIASIGLVTYAIRLSFILFLARTEMPPLLLKILRFVPIAVLSAIIFPQLFLPQGTINVSLANPRWIAGLLAALVAWRTRKIFLTIIVGMIALWTLQWLLPLLPV